MREIKFRAWDSERLHFDYLCLTLYGAITQNFGGRQIEMVGWKLMQFTGLKDRNGVEIYEGDIVQPLSSGDECFESRYNEETDEFICLPMLVRWMDDYQAFDLVRLNGTSLEAEYNLFSADPYIEVIGNIYSNPELLEATK